jgi:hypothetical protein
MHLPFLDIATLVLHVAALPISHCRDSSPPNSYILPLARPRLQPAS